MKTLLTALAVTLALSAPTFADDSGCAQLANSAKAIMTARQAGLPIEMPLNLYKDAEYSEDLRKLMRNITITAYKSPRFSMESNQVNAAADYYNDVYLKCITR